MPTHCRHGTPAVALWLAGTAAAMWIAVRAHYVADLSAFLPAAPTPEQAVLLDQLRSGAASRLVLIGIEGGADASEPGGRDAGDATAAAAVRADASRHLADAMRASGLFAAVDNGDRAGWEEAGRFIFAYRYALSPAVDAARFSIDGLREAIADAVALLGTPAGSMLKPILFRDPTGETVRIAEALMPARAPRVEGGVWVSRASPRAVLVATTKADGGDLDGQQQAIVTIRSAFAQAAPALHLQISGAGSFGVASRDRIKAEVGRLALLGSGLMVVLLALAFASLRSLVVALLPVATGVLAGIAAVSIGFGQVHGMTLGFGTTLIGEAVDYAIYFLIQARTASDDVAPATLGGVVSPPVETPVERWLRRSWPTVRLGLFTSLVGFAALVFAGFPGLAQLGIFSIIGLAAAAATTRFVFPVLAPRGAPGQGLRRQLGRFMQGAAAVLPRYRGAFAFAALAAVAALVFLPTPWRGVLSSLSPIDAGGLALDASLRADVGAPDAGTLIAVSAASEGEALEGAGAVGARRDRHVRDGALQGYDSPARLLPSAKTQGLRRAALPDSPTLAARLAAATEGGALPADRLEPVVADVQAARATPPLARSALDATPLAVAVDSLLLRGDGSHPWRALINLQVDEGGALDAARIRAAIADLPAARLVAVKAELDALYARYLQEAGWQAALGALAVIVLLAWHLRSARRLVVVAWAIAAATLIVLGALAASGAALGILHLVGLLLTVAIGSNYALFFDHLREQPDADPDTLASLLLANLTTVVSFGLLATSRIPVLQAIGAVVAPGTLLCLVLSAAFIARPHGKIALP